MNPIDVLILARTKLRTHKIRTGIIVTIAGLVFGLIIAVMVMLSGVFASIDRFGQIGLNNRVLLTATSSKYPYFNPYDHINDPNFINQVDEEYKTQTEKIKQVAKKYSIEYDAASNPSPVTVDQKTKAKSISESELGNPIVQKVSDKLAAEKFTPLDFDKLMSKYSGYVKRGKLTSISPITGSFEEMKEGKEDYKDKKSRQDSFTQPGESPVQLTTLDQSVSDPFIVDKDFDYTKGEIPVIVPFAQAEKALGLKKLSKSASVREQRDRLKYVREHVKDVKVSFCYRNSASQSLVSSAKSQQKELLKNVNNKDYVKPSVIYNDFTNDCSAITVKSDTRTPAEKKLDENREAYEKELDMYAGDPVQYKVVVRGVGISGDVDYSQMTFSMKSFVVQMLNTNLGYGTWTIPSGMLAKVAPADRPNEVFAPFKEKSSNSINDNSSIYEPYIVEFTDKDQARKFYKDFSDGSGDVYVTPFGSGTLLLDDLRRGVSDVLKWVLLIVGFVAVLILWGIIGRTVADSKRESAVFRAIGATRLDIANIYGLYVLLLALRIVIFSLLLGFALALAFDLWTTDTATVAAQLAYAAVDTNAQFHMIGFPVNQLSIIVGVIVLAALVASIIPILLGARRNPIKDMRDE